MIKYIIHIVYIVIFMLNCASERDICYANEVDANSGICEIFIIASIGSDPLYRKNIMDVSTYICFQQIKRIKKCDEKSNIFPASFGP